MRGLITMTLLASIISAGAEAAPKGPIWDGIPVAYDVDVIVLGGGPSGVSAAISAARNLPPSLGRRGAGGVGRPRVLLIEQYSFLGGMGTAAEVNVFMTWANIGGVFQEMLARLQDVGGRVGSQFDIPLMQCVLDDMVHEAGVHILYYTRGIAATTGPGKPWQKQPTHHITGLVIQNKSGIQLARAKVYIDCSGDGDLAAFAGAPFEVGRPEDGATMPMTMVFRVGGATWKGGDLVRYHPDFASYWTTATFSPNPGEVTFNATRILGHLGINGESLSDATVIGRHEVLKMFKLLKDNVPGFEHAYLLALPTQVGVRETRRIVGANPANRKQVLTAEDVLEGRMRTDVIARCRYDVDIHNPTGTGTQIIRLKQPYDIPYRCLIPRGVDNLLIAGRPISADTVANSSLRVQPTCYALGQAAGTAAAMCAKLGLGPWDMDPHIRELQTTLVHQGADLGEYRAERLGLRQEWRRWQIQYRRNNASVPKGGFSDLPPGNPAHDAAIELAKIGVFSGTGDGKFGAEQVAGEGQVVVVIVRALGATELEPPPNRLKVELPANLKGKWWSDNLLDLAERGIITADELRTFDPGGADEATLRTWLERAFPKAAGKIGPLPEELRRPGALTRGAVAWMLWEAVR